MRTYTARDLRSRQAEALNFAAAGEPVAVARRGADDVVIISKAEYEAYAKAKFDREFAPVAEEFHDLFKALADK
jgi:prevent-host-death family protein